MEQNDMGDITFEIIFIFILLILNGLFSMSEMAIISARKALLHKRALDGDKGARAALDLAESPGSFLSTVQVGITLVGILAGAFGGATIAEKMAPALKQLPVIEPYADKLSFGLVVLIITYFSLVIGELIPKRLALHSPDRIARAVAAPMKRLARITSPLVAVLEGSTNGLLRLFGLRESEDPPVTEDEIKVLIEQGIHAGVFEEAERDVIERTFHLGDRKVSELMVPRPDVVFIDLDDPPEVHREVLSGNRLSRYPVIRGAPDNVIGILRAKDLLARELTGQPFNLEAILAPPIFFPESMAVFRAIEMFKSSRRHLALVIDEHGGIEGLVTVNDILDALVGDIPSMDEAIELSVVRREDGSFLMDGALPIDLLKQILRIKHLPDEKDGVFQTLGGFLMIRLGRVPAVADTIEFGGWRFEIMDMDRRRVDKVLVSATQKS
ncbi:MAG: hemolysin family protein [Blastocatellia bacterium]